MGGTLQKRLHRIRKIKYSSVCGKSYSNAKELLEKKRAEVYSGINSNTGITVGKLIEVWLADIKYKLKALLLTNFPMELLSKKIRRLKIFFALSKTASNNAVIAFAHSHSQTG